MLATMHDDLERPRFSWPEPLVVECLREHYGTRFPSLAATRLAVIHGQALRRSLGEGDPPGALTHPDLLDLCARVGIGRDEVERIDRAVLVELLALIRVRFRNSRAVADRIALHLRRRMDATVKASAAARPVAEPPRGRL